ncbi:hypothetical protein GCM10018954_043900 [Kutzneria kofuensis]
MPLFDLSEPELAEHRVTATEPDGLDAWWADRIAGARASAEPVSLVRHEELAYGPMPVWDVEFSGDGGDRIKGRYLRPARLGTASGCRSSCGTSGTAAGRGLPLDHTLWAAAGYAVLVMDTRGQGARWSIGATGDPGRSPAGRSFHGVMSRGIASPETYYYTRLFVDRGAVRAVDVASNWTVGSGADRGQRGSQGGGWPSRRRPCRDRVRVCHADIRSCATSTGRSGFSRSRRTPRSATSSHSTWIWCGGRRRVRKPCGTWTAPCWPAHHRHTPVQSVWLMDMVCPPSTVYARTTRSRRPRRSRCPRSACMTCRVGTSSGSYDTSASNLG